MAEGQVLFNAVFVRVVDGGGTTEAAATLGPLGFGEVASAGAEAQDFAAGGNFEPFGGGLLGFDAFWTSHK